MVKRRIGGHDLETGSWSGWHVGFVAEGLVQRGMLLMLSGNSRDSVRYGRYPMDKYSIKGYRWPILRQP